MTAAGTSTIAVLKATKTLNAFAFEPSLGKTNKAGALCTCPVHEQLRMQQHARKDAAARLRGGGGAPHLMMLISRVPLQTTTRTTY